jgi:hypothetical protein
MNNLWKLEDNMIGIYKLYLKIMINNDDVFISESYKLMLII